MLVYESSSFDLLIYPHVGEAKATTYWCFMDMCEEGRKAITELLLSCSGMTGRFQEEEVFIFPDELYVNSNEKCCQFTAESKTTHSPLIYCILKSISQTTHMMLVTPEGTVSKA